MHRNLHQTFPHFDLLTRRDLITDLKTFLGEDDDGGSVFGPPQFFAGGDFDVTGNLIRTLPPQVQQNIQEVKSNGGHQDCGHRNDGDRLLGFQAQVDRCPFVFTKQPFDAFERDRVHVPGVATDVGDVFHGGIRRGVKAVVHRGFQPKRDVASIVKGSRRRFAPKQISQKVGKPFGLKDSLALHGATGTDNAIAGTRHHGAGGINGPGSRAQLTGETIVQAREPILFRFAQVEVREQSPCPDREPGEVGASDFADAADQAGQKDSRHTIGEEKVQVLLEQQLVSPRFDSGRFAGGGVDVNCGIARVSHDRKSI